MKKAVQHCRYTTQALILHICKRNVATGYNLSNFGMYRDVLKMPQSISQKPAVGEVRNSASRLQRPQLPFTAIFAEN